MTQPRNPLQIEIYRRPYHQVDPVPNLLAGYALKNAPFFANASEPDRFWPKPPIQDHIWNGTTTRGIPVPAVQAVQFRGALQLEIYPRRYLQIEQQSSLVLKTLVAGTPPFTPPQFQEVYRRIDRDFLQMETLSYLPGPVIAPYIPVDFPTPMRARANPQDFFFESTKIPPPAPFNQTDWQPVYKFRQLAYGFELSGVSTRGIPSGINTPFVYNDWIMPLRARNVVHDIPPNVTILGPPQPFPFFATEWPTPLRPKDRPGESYSSPQILLITPVLRPFAQTDWPPLPMRRPITPQADFGWEAWNTIYRPAAPVGVLIMPNLLGDNIYEAMKLLQQAGIYVPNTNYFAEFSSITVKWGKSTIYPAGTVMAQSIIGGTITFKGAPLTLTIVAFPFSSLIDLPPDWKQ